MSKYHFSCLHELGLVPYGVPVSDHHPLSMEEIGSLLQAAAAAGDVGDSQTVASIQERLCQGIVGYECPNLIDGKVGQKQSMLCDLFVMCYCYGADPNVVQQMYIIMNGD